MTSPAPSLSKMQFAFSGRGAPFLVLPRATGLDLLDWLGVGRPEFGAIEARALAPRCRRRLWPLPRNDHPCLHELSRELLRALESAGDALVVFG